MVAFRFKNVVIEGMATEFPDTEVTSAEIEDKISHIYQRLGVPMGTLDRLSGIKTRKMWEPEFTPSMGATNAVKKLLEETGFDRSLIGAVVNCSVTRDYFEPATACLVQKNIGLPEDVMSFDVTNACVGFSNGLMILSNWIDSGIIKAGIVVSSENTSIIARSTFINLQAESEQITREKLIRVVPTLTLGCGAVAYLVCHESVSQSLKKGKAAPKIKGGVACSATQHVELCAGNGDFSFASNFDNGSMPLMETEAAELINSAAKLGGRTWKKASEVLGWSSEDVDHVVCHQVGKQVNEAFYAELGLDFKKDFSIYRDYGNMVSVALPSAVAIASKEIPLKTGDKLVTTAYGSGLHSIFLGIEW